MKWTPAKTIVRGIAGRGDPREGEGVAHVVGDVLDLRRLVVVRQEDGVPLGGEPADLGRASRLPLGPGDQLVAVGAGSVAVTGASGGVVVLYSQSKTYGADRSIPDRALRLVLAGPARPIRTRRSPSSLQVRAGRLHVMLWRRATEPFAGAWALPGGPLLADETLGASVARQLASKVEVRQLAHLEQLETRSDPGRDPRGRTVATAYLGLIPSRPGPRAARGHRLAPHRRAAGDGVRPRLDRRVGAGAGCGRSSRTRTSGSPWRRRRSRSPSCGTSTSPRSATR